jgi:hypothetical protein
MSTLRELFDSLAAVRQCIDRGSLELACRRMQEHDALVRGSFSTSAAAGDGARHELLSQHRDLQIKVSALRDDMARKIGDLRRSRAAFREYLGLP